MIDPATGAKVIRPEAADEVARALKRFAYNYALSKQRSLPRFYFLQFALNLRKAILLTLCQIEGGLSKFLF
jgi:hypothetical protein